jgi:dihydrofolate reductase
MGKLIYSTTASADGYIEDAGGSFDWTAPDDEVFRFVSDLLRPVGTYLFGRRLYETMLYWETARTVPDQPPLAREFAAIWEAADKIVFSATLGSVSSPRTRIERKFDPGLVAQLKSAAGHDMVVGGADLAGQAIKAGLVDELRLFLVPSSSAEASGPSPTVPVQIWNCWTRGGSQAVPSTSGTAPSQRESPGAAHRIHAGRPDRADCEPVNGLADGGQLRRSRAGR